MDLELNSDQRALVDAVAQLVSHHLLPPREGNVGVAVHAHYSEALDRELGSGGYYRTAREEGYGPLEAALVVEEVTRSPSVVEIATSALVAPQLSKEEFPRPIAIAQERDLGRPVRFLDRAKTLLVDCGEEAAVLGVASGDVESVPSMFAYPYGKFRSSPALGKATRLGMGSGARLRHWARVALAVEAGAAMSQAVRFTAEYVKNRRQFGRPIGSFQAVQHRLAVDIQLAEGTMWLARRAAWSGIEADAAVAALHAQEAIPTITYDCHQFNGALGMTLEHPLHFWTFRLRALQGELGAAPAQARAVAQAVWG